MRSNRNPGSSAAERPGLCDALKQLRAGDTLVVWRLDRLGRSLKYLIARAEALRIQGVGLQSLKEAIDSDSAGGRLILHIFGALAEFERALIRERNQRNSGYKPSEDACMRSGPSRRTRDARSPPDSHRPGSSLNNVSPSQRM